LIYGGAPPSGAPFYFAAIYFTAFIAITMRYFIFRI
jgi:hypothetical protein